MEVIRTVDEHYMVAKFLDAELSSPRHRAHLSRLMAEAGIPVEFIRVPDLQDEQQNKARDRLLTQIKGWQNNQLLFEGFPAQVKWYEVELTPEEVDNLIYINFDYWRELSGGSRLVKDAVQNVRQGKTAWGESNQKYFDIAAEIEHDRDLPEIILVASDTESKLHILEGHYRATGYGLADRRPRKIRALLGINPAISQWHYI